MPIDPQLVDVDALQQSADDTLQFIDQLTTEEEEREEAVQTEVAEQTQGQAEIDDPRNKEDWGVAGVAKELQSVLTGGLQDTASSMATFPERTVDALSGEMQREKKEKGYYRPEWSPFVDYENPIITKTWWGKLARGFVHFGSMAAVIVPAAKVTLGRLGLGAVWALSLIHI